MRPEDWIGRPITDRDGRPYGALDELFVGHSTGEPEFGIVSVDRQEGPGTKRVAVPLGGARIEGDVVVLPLDPGRVREAPEVQRTVDNIPPEAGEVIHAYFAHGAEPTTAMPPTTPVDAATPPVPAADGDGTAGEAEVTVSEEELVVDKEAHATGRVRLRKVVVEEEVTVTVTLRREELRIEREPLPPDTEVRRGSGDEQLVEGELEFVLLAEKPVVEKRVVPVERVKVARDTIVEQRRIADEVRKERVEVDDAGAPDLRPAPPRS